MGREIVKVGEVQEKKRWKEMKREGDCTPRKAHTSSTTFL